MFLKTLNRYLVFPIVAYILIYDVETTTAMLLYNFAIYYTLILLAVFVFNLVKVVRVVERIDITVLARLCKTIVHMYIWHFMLGWNICRRLDHLDYVDFENYLIMMTVCNIFVIHILFFICLFTLMSIYIYDIMLFLCVSMEFISI